MVDKVSITITIEKLPQLVPGTDVWSIIYDHPEAGHGHSVHHLKAEWTADPQAKTSHLRSWISADLDTILPILQEKGLLP